MMYDLLSSSDNIMIPLLEKEVIYLPAYPGLNPSETAYIAEIIKVL